MIRTLIAHGGGLIRGALAFALGAHDDIEVVGQVGRYEEVTGAVREHDPQVTIFDVDLLPREDLSGMRALRWVNPERGVVMLVEARQAARLTSLLAINGAGVGFVAKDGPLTRLLGTVRRVSKGESVVDPELVISAVRTSTPLTRRETQILVIAADGGPVGEIAATLSLSQGTVRNHLSRIIGKTGARTRVEAVKIARDAGWI